MPHNVAADAADRAPSTASAIGVAAPGAWPLRWTRAAVLAAAKAAPSCKASFMAFYMASRTHTPPPIILVSLVDPSPEDASFYIF